MDKTYADVEIGLNVLEEKRATLRAGYIGKFSNHLKSNGAMVKLSIPF